MEATHFIEVWGVRGNPFAKGYSINVIEELNDYLSATAKNSALETKAVWRIKPTDIPLQTRLDLRKLGIGYSQVDDGALYKIDASKYKYENLSLSKINIPKIWS